MDANQKAIPRLRAWRQSSKWHRRHQPWRYAQIEDPSPPHNPKCRHSPQPLRYQKWTKQLCFLRHIYRGLRTATDSRPEGRAAVVIPDLQGHATPEVLADLSGRVRRGGGCREGAAGRAKPHSKGNWLL
jgi:hypothetical protein